MRSIFLTGSTGFVGSYIQSNFKHNFYFKNYVKDEKITINEEIVLHFAGKAHDLKNINNPKEYYEVNTELTKNVYNSFLKSDSKIFITLSSVKAVADNLDCELTEDHIANPITHYGKSKLLGEQYILNKELAVGKRVYILRPCMIHGPGNKGNLNLLFKIVTKGLPWPLGAFENKRSFCSIDNLCFIINELIENDQIPSGIYNISDDEPVSTNEIIRLIALSSNKKVYIWKIPKFIIYTFYKLGNLLKLSLNTERLNKLTETYIISNNKILNVINKSLPLRSKDGLIKTFNSFNH
jgi:nucleoside-diphosphate-sugar epimerase